jgi:hypothetical protein
VHVDNIGALSPEHIFDKRISVRIPHVNSVPDWLNEEGLFGIVIRRVEVQWVKPVDVLSLRGLVLGSCARNGVVVIIEISCTLLSRCAI